MTAKKPQLCRLWADLSRAFPKQPRMSPLPCRHHCHPHPFPRSRAWELSWRELLYCGRMHVASLWLRLVVPGRSPALLLCPQPAGTAWPLWPPGSCLPPLHHPVSLGCKDPEEPKVAPLKAMVEHYSQLLSARQDIQAHLQAFSQMNQAAHQRLQSLEDSHRALVPVTAA